MSSSDSPIMKTLITLAEAALATYGRRWGGLLSSERLPCAGAFRAFTHAMPGTILLSLVVLGIWAAGP